MPTVTSGLLPFPDPGPWEAFLANNVQYNIDPTDQANIDLVRSMWEGQRKAAATGATSYSYGAPLVSGTRISDRLTAGLTQVGPGQYVKTPIPTVSTNLKASTAAKLPVPVAAAATLPATISSTPAPGSQLQPSEARMSGTLSSLGSLVGTGSVIAGPVGGAVGAGLSIITGLTSLGKSKCSGPYNYNPATGGCDPKPGTLTGTGTVTNPCSPGYTWNGSQCVKTGVVGTIQQTLPGGQTGTQMDIYGNAVMGRYGPALVPAVIAQPVRKCPPGMILGKDGNCYDQLANKERMWPKGARPVLTGGEVKTLRKAKSLTKKVQRAWAAAGKPGQAKPRRTTTRRK